MEAEESKSNYPSKSDLVQLARDRFRLAAEATEEQRRLSLEDLKFCSGDQWPTELKTQRAEDGRPCLTVNRLPQFVRQVTNDQRQNRPAIKVSPVDDAGDKDLAAVYQGLIRHIEYDSNADIAYDTAFMGAVRKGFGYMRVITEYVDPMSFELQIKIKPIPDDFAVYLDPFHEECDGSDLNWAQIITQMPKEEFKKAYPKAELSKMSDWESLGHRTDGWVEKDGCKVAEYFYKECTSKTIVKVLDPDSGAEQVMFKEEFTGPEDAIIEERDTQIEVIKWCKHNGMEVLEETEWDGKYIPIIPVYGEETYIEGRRMFEGLVRHAKDPQRMYNFWTSAQTEMIALAPKAPYVGAAGAFAGFENQWKTANTKNHAFLQYNPVLIGDEKPAPPPTRVFGEPPVQAITQALMGSNEDLKGTMGIYDASLGNRSNESSGIAIQRRNVQAQTNNFHFADNLRRSITHLGRILVDLIPKVYDTPRAIRIIGEEGNEEIVKINQVFEKRGEEKKYSMGAGKYDVTVTTGPSYMTKRQEASEAMLEVTKAYPQIMQIAPDLLVKNMDWPGADELASRLKKTVPPDLLESEEGEDFELPPQLAAQLQQQQQMMEQMQQALAEAQDIINNKTLELESKERIELLKAETDLRIALLKETGADDRLAFEKEIAELDKKQELLNGSGRPQQAPAVNQGAI